MTRETVQVEARARLDQVSRVVTARSARPQRDDFIITRNGLYLGLGRTFDLLRQITAPADSGGAAFQPAHRTAR